MPVFSRENGQHNNVMRSVWVEILPFTDPKDNKDKTVYQISPQLTEDEYNILLLNNPEFHTDFGSAVHFALPKGDKMTETRIPGRTDESRLAIGEELGRSAALIKGFGGVVVSGLIDSKEVFEVISIDPIQSSR